MLDGSFVSIARETENFRRVGTILGKHRLGESDCQDGVQKMFHKWEEIAPGSLFEKHPKTRKPIHSAGGATCL